MKYSEHTQSNVRLARQACCQQFERNTTGKPPDILMSQTPPFPPPPSPARRARCRMFREAKAENSATDDGLRYATMPDVTVHIEPRIGSRDLTGAGHLTLAGRR